MSSYKLASNTWDEKEIQAIQSVVDSGIYSMGDFVSKYEKDFTNFFNTKYSVMVNSGSSANLLMIAAMFFVKDESLRLKREMKSLFQQCLVNNLLPASTVRVACKIC